MISRGPDSLPHLNIQTGKIENAGIIFTRPTSNFITPNYIAPPKYIGILHSSTGPKDAKSSGVLGTPKNAISRLFRGSNLDEVGAKRRR